MPNVTFDVSSATTTKLVDMAAIVAASPGLAGRRIRVTGWSATAAGTNVATLQDSNGTPRVLDTFLGAAGVTKVMPPSEDWELDCTAGKDLNLVTTGTGRVAGQVSYKILG